METVTYYRVDLANGITVEEKPSGFYRRNREYGRTIFKNLRRAKAAFSTMSKAEISRLDEAHKQEPWRLEIERLHRLRRKLGPMTKREQLKAHAYLPAPPEALAKDPPQLDR